ncbi:DUF1661 domain-containing protein [Porphyromonas gulae]|uniref:DUF1661 domain-containing protein n=1 Tax=Porphyromonas gulae TaxID=111105 RepID=UPI001F3A679C|nr:DUF1661 domain-containing protein [Porphyromonas gulae]
MVREVNFLRARTKTISRVNPRNHVPQFVRFRFRFFSIRQKEEEERVGREKIRSQSRP